MTTPTTATATAANRKLEIANTILLQLGGKRFRVMTGARDFIATDKGLQFKLPSKPHYTKNGINCIQIEFDEGLDLFTMRFGRVWTSRGVPDYKELSTESHVYAGDLQRFFTDATGLDTHL